MTKTIGVIGLGSIGARHARNLMAMGHIVHGFDPIETTGQPPEIIRHGTVDGMIDSVEAVIIASPTPRHYFDIADALFELKPVFCEKPIADRLPDLEDSFKAITMVGYNLRFHSCVKRAKEWLDAGLIGKPLWANFTLGQYSEKPPYLRDGVILNWSHEIDLALYLLGPAQVARQFTRVTNGKDDMTDIMLLHEDRVSSSIHLDYLSKPEQRHFTITGTNGHLHANLVERWIDYWPPDRKVANSERFQGSDIWNDNYIEEMQAFIDRIDGKETIGCTGAEGLEVLKICLEVRRQAGL